MPNFNVNLTGDDASKLLKTIDEAKAALKELEVAAAKVSSAKITKIEVDGLRVEFDKPISQDEADAWISRYRKAYQFGTDIFMAAGVPS